MHKIMRGGVIVALGAFLIACEPAIRVHTSLSPDASLRGLRTFHILRVPARHSYRRPSVLDPMIYNSATNRSMRNALRDAFEDRGYFIDEAHPDFAIAYYATAREKLDVTMWDYGYHWPRWWGTRMVTAYREGSVIIDVVDPRTEELLWRGTGIAVVSDDPARFRKDLAHTVAAIVAEFPAARALYADAGH
jgi:hypothetical protein